MSKPLMVSPRKVLAEVYDLEFTCPYCKAKNLIYHFQDWCYKKRFWCQKCHKVVYKPVEGFDSKL